MHVLLIILFSLVKVAYRPHVDVAIPPKAEARIAEEAKDMSDKEVIDLSLKLTAELLTFSEKNDLSHGKANCVGYARLCAGICNKAFETTGSKSKARPVVGYIKMGGVNLCNLAQSVMPTRKWQSFTKDHDFVEVVTGKEVIYFDPSLYDVTGNSHLTSRAYK